MNSCKLALFSVFVPCDRASSGRCPPVNAHCISNSLELKTGFSPFEMFLFLWEAMFYVLLGAAMFPWSSMAARKNGVDLAGEDGGECGSECAAAGSRTRPLWRSSSTGASESERGEGRAVTILDAPVLAPDSLAI